MLSGVDYSPDSDPTPVLPENPKKESSFVVNLKTVGAVAAIIIAALTQGGVLPPVVASAPVAPPPPCQPCDSAFQSDVRASLDRLSASLGDIRERLARLEGPSR